VKTRAHAVPLGLCLTLALAAALVAPATRAHATRAARGDGARPLWPGSRYTEADRERAVLRGLRFVYRTALVESNFAGYGSDYLWCFYSVSASVADARVRREARRMGRERARRWRDTHRALPEGATAAEVADFVFGDDAAASLGLRDARLRAELRRAAARFMARDFMLFDPASEPPPADVPADCETDRAAHPRGTRFCRRCGRALRMRTRQDVWYDALIMAYTGERAGVPLGASYAEVFRWLPALRPYRNHAAGEGGEEFHDTAYALTHVVYTLNDYGQRRLSPRELPAEFEFLRANLRAAVALGDADMLGEFVDSLRAFGLTERDPEIRAGVEYLLANQNEDGSWGDADESDIYLRYHPTWNGVAALSRYAWRGRGRRPPRLAPARAGPPARPRS
jgi:hypothetical protein